MIRAGQHGAGTAREVERWVKGASAMGVGHGQVDVPLERVDPNQPQVQAER